MLRRVCLWMGCVAVLCLAGPGVAAEQLVRYPAGALASDFRYAYPVRVLQLALDKTRKAYGPARAVQGVQTMNTARAIAELERGTQLDIATFPAQRELESRLLPIPICIRKGILGIRLFLIDRRRQPEFSAIKDLASLKRLNPGQGQDWLDTQVLGENGFSVVTGASYEGLFGMLLAGRFDFFPRGLHEPFVELTQRQAQMPELAVEETLALHYPYPDYFWVRKDNTRLAERIRKGLEAAIADGSFEKQFQQEYAEVIRLAHLDKRRIFHLPNPAYGDLPHPGDRRYWLMESK